MGVDYDASAGIGIRFTEEHLQKVISNGLFTQKEWDDEYYGCMEKLGVYWNEAGGRRYTGNYEDRRLYLFIEGTTLKELNEGVEEFISTLAKIGIDIVEDDIVLYKDIYVN